MAEILLSDLTETSLTGNGVFDGLMRTVKLHLDEEYKNGRIRGQEFATVYLGAIQSVMDRSLQFLMDRQRADQEAQLLAAQVLHTNKQVEIADAEILIKQAQVDATLAEVAIAEAKLVNLPKEGALLDAQVAQMNAQTGKVAIEINRLNADIGLTNAQTSKVALDADMVAAQTANVEAELLGINAKTSLTNQQVTNAVTENTVLIAQECKLRAEFDHLAELRLKTAAETVLINQKRVTEQAQTSGTGVDADSVIGRQKALYAGQTAGFARDAEQKAAKLLVDTWNVRRTTNDGTDVNDSNMLGDPSIGRVINALLAGINA